MTFSFLSQKVDELKDLRCLLASTEGKLIEANSRAEVAETNRDVFAAKLADVERRLVLVQQEVKRLRNRAEEAEAEARVKGLRAEAAEELFVVQQFETEKADAALQAVEASLAARQDLMEAVRAAVVGLSTMVLLALAVVGACGRGKNNRILGIILAVFAASIWLS